MIKLVFTDVDGTLVGSSGTVLPAVWEGAKRVRAAKIHLAICTGRPAFGDTLGYARRLDADGWHVFQNGASVLHLATAQSLSTPLPRASVGALIERARSIGRILELYTDSAYAVESTAPRAREHARLLGVPFEPRPFESLEGTIVRAQWLVALDEEDAALADETGALERSASTSPVMPDTCFVNMTAPGVDKARAVRSIAAQYDVPLEDVMFVGDGNNDLAALRAVGHPVAMANADASVLTIARRTVGHVDDAGLVEAFDVAIESHAARGAA
ncbi:MAG: Cof-type HAD-IIB family hydrolase [Gemmatimonadaceae bacterium]